MNIAIYGSKIGATRLMHLIEGHYLSASVGFFIENKDFNAIGSRSDGVEIISVVSARNKYLSGDIKGVLIPGVYHKNIIDDAIRLLLKNGFHEDDIYVTPNNLFKKDKICDEEIPSIMTKYKELVQLFDVVVHVNDHCNLNCKACCVYSSLVKEPLFYDIDDFRKDIHRLGELVKNIHHISFLGGEPLLNPSIESYIYEARRVYPYAHMTLTTNGILLPKVKESFYKCISENNVTIKLSLYPPLVNQIDELIHLLKTKNADFFVEPIYQFCTRFSLHPLMSKHEGMKKCKYQCLGMRDGMLNRCELALNVHHFNKYYKTELPEVGGIDIHDTMLTGRRLIEMLEEPLDLCAFCAEGLIFEYSEWEKSEDNPPIGDYLTRYTKILTCSDSCKV